MLIAGMHMYEESQSLEGDNAVKAGLKWLFGILDDTTRDKMTDSIYKPIADKLAEQQKTAEVKKQETST